MGIVRRKKQDVAADIPARRLADIQRVGAAFIDHRATPAHLLGSLLALHPSLGAAVLQLDSTAAAGSPILPISMRQP